MKFLFTVWQIYNINRYYIWLLNKDDKSTKERLTNQTECDLIVDKQNKVVYSWILKKIPLIVAKTQSTDQSLLSPQQIRYSPMACADLFYDKINKHLTNDLTKHF